MDCGAYVGYSASYFLNKYPSVNLIAIEPDPENFNICKKNLLPYKDRVNIVQAALWSHQTGLIVYHENPSEGCEWGMKVRECKENESSCVNAFRIDDLLSKSNFDQIDILKIDIEKAEKVIFSINYEKWLHNVRNIVIELHDEESEEIFFKALASFSYTLSQSGELTVCKNISPLNEG